MKNITKKFHYFDLLWELIKTSFKLRYQNSVLGFLWVLIKPYSTFLVQYFVWTRVVRQDVPNYGLYLLLGVIMYTYFNELIILGQNSLLERSNIILKVNFPRQIAIVSALINALINLFINMIFFMALLAINHIQISLSGTIYFVFIVITMFTFSLGLSFFSSIMTIKLRDLKNVFELGLFILFWLTPIFYYLGNDNFIGDFSRVLRLNPLGELINQSRAGFNIVGDVSVTGVAVIFLFSLVFLFLGWRYFSVNIKKIAEYF